MSLLVGALAAAGLLMVVMFGSVLGALTGGDGAAGAGGDSCAPAPTGRATADIPRAFLALYVKAGKAYGIGGHILAAVGKVESDHGRGDEAGIRSGANSAGAAGPMQFLPGTWRAFRRDGNGDGHTDIYDPADAIPSAAAYLKHNGAPTQLRRALFAYNHADWYVTKVRRQAAAYAHDGAQGGAPEACAGGIVAGTGHAAVAIRAATRWIGTPYSWGGGGLSGPTRGIGRGAGTTGFDCSGLTRYAWHQAGATLPRVAADQQRAARPVPAGQQQPGDLVFFTGAGGTRSSPGHVGLLVGPGRMIEAPQTGAKVRLSNIKARSDLIGYARPIPR